MHIVTIVTMQTPTSFHKTNLPVDTRHKVTYIHDMYFSHICHFRPMTQPNPLKTQFSIHSQPNPTQPNPRVNPTHGQLWVTLSWSDLKVLQQFLSKRFVSYIGNTMPQFLPVEKNWTHQSRKLSVVANGRQLAKLSSDDKVLKLSDGQKPPPTDCDI